MASFCPQCRAALAPGTSCRCGGSAPGVDLSASDSELPKIPGYRPVRWIGRGGRGRVFEAVQESLGRKVVVQVFPPERGQDPHFVKRFQREASVLAQLNHPGIVRVIDRGNVGNLYYLVTEHVDGSTIANRRLPPGETLRLAREIASALSHAHGRGVLHRDLQPDRILMDASGAARIVGFGVAHLVAGFGEGAGTQPYRAPEETERPAEADHRSDLFSFGMILYEMLTGHRPEGAFEPPSAVVPGLDARWDEIIEKAIQRSPDRRHADVDEMIRALRALEAPGAAADRPAVVGRCACGTDNPSDVKFCTGCGKSVLVPCPACRVDNRIGSKFCGSCGRDLTRLVRIEDARTQLADAMRRGLAEGASFDERRAALLRARDFARELATLDTPADFDPAAQIEALWTKRLQEVVRQPDRYAAYAEHQACLLDLPNAPGRDALRALEEERTGLLARMSEDLLARRHASVLRMAETSGWGRDPEVQALRTKCENARLRARNIVKDQLPEMQKSRRHVAMKKTLQELEDLGVPVTGIDAYRAEADRRIQEAQAAANEGREILTRRDPDRAIARFEQARAICSDLPDAEQGHAEAVATKERCVKALAKAEECLASGDPRTAMMHARLCSAGWDVSRAKEICEEALARHAAGSRRRLLIAGGSVGALLAIAFIAFLVLRTGAQNKTILWSVEQGEAEFNRRNYNAAEEHFRAAGDHPAALEGLQKIQKARSDAEAHHAAAREKLSAYDLAAARERAQACLSIDPSHPGAHKVIQECDRRAAAATKKLDEARTAYGAGDFETAKKLYAEILDVLPDHQGAKDELRGLNEHLDSIRHRAEQAAQALEVSRPREALDLVNEILKSIPDHPDALKIRAVAETALLDAAKSSREGDALLTNGKREEAEQAYRRALLIDASNERALTMLRAMEEQKTTKPNAGEFPVVSLFPMEPGNEWIYRGTIKGGQESGEFRQTDRIDLAEEDLGGLRCRILRSRRDDGQGWMHYYSADADGVRWAGTLEEEDLSLFSKPPLFLKRDFSSGGTWTTLTTLGTSTVSLTVNVLSLSAEVRTPAGEFRTTQVNYRYTGLTPGSLSITYWFADGVGPVRIARVEQFGSQSVTTELTLDSYRIPSQKEMMRVPAKGIDGRAMDAPILEGLKWLSRHQLSDGSWRTWRSTMACGTTKGYGQTGACISPTTAEEHEVGVTSLAILAFLAAGFDSGCNDLYDGINFGDCVRRGLRFLIEMQLKDGRIGSAGTGRAFYDHALATLALARGLRGARGAEGAALADLLRDSLEAAVEYMLVGRRTGCTACGGKGRSKEKCGMCGGTAKCRTCQGMGHLHQEKGCGVCDGVIGKTDLRLLCGTCVDKGSGRCGICAGTGSANGRACYSCAKRPGVCSSCAGKGTLNGAACAACLRVKPGSGKCLACKKTGYATCPSCKGSPKIGAATRRGWRYSRTSTDSDMSVTAWCLQALHAAQAAGVSFDREILAGVFAWMNEITDSRTGHVGYLSGFSTGRNVIQGINDTYEGHPTMSAAAVACRLLWDAEPGKQQSKAIDLVATDPPSESFLKGDTYYWYFGTWMFHQIRDARWQTWKTEILKLLRGRQLRRTGDCANGSWDADDRWGVVGGRVYATAIDVITLCYATLPTVYEVKTKRDEPETPAQWTVHLTGGRKITAISHTEKDGKIILELVGGGKATIDKADVVKIEPAK